jgi:hypothetical protein
MTTASSKRAALRSRAAAAVATFEGSNAAFMVVQTHQVLRAATGDGAGQAIDPLRDADESFLHPLEMSRMDFQHVDCPSQYVLDAAQPLVCLLLCLLETAKPSEGEIHDRHRPQCRTPASWHARAVQANLHDRGEASD